ncbi:signal peptide peptidase SppA [Arenibacter sp. GZD96]|uniref:signal peptide peptidase SppA n=1 Tax=Aurantibrevibacter litoralis TaxID=3106030 RepID=UPI002AFECBFE|nr:signal peptide peptidase SppA [Arenibacter sp. GZD-96]MEA1784721.1 signal peptide peptidase SppA [Arenibacter sp. GZD-96]
MNFLRNLVASILGSLIALGILFFMLFVLIALIGSTEDSISIKNNSVLTLQITKPLEDYVGNDDTDPFSGFFSENQGLDDVLQAIKTAKEDSHIKGISIANNFILAGLAQTQAIRKALADFKSSGKFIYAYSDFFMQKDYYLASVADEIYLNAQGAVDFKGLSTEVLFFKDLQEKSGVKMEVIRHGKYKSAVEPFLANEMSQDNRNQIQALLASLWETIVTDIADSRAIAVSDLNAIADTLGGRTSKYANLSGLVDGTVHFDEYELFLKDKLGLSMEEDISYVDLSAYIKNNKQKKGSSIKDKIAIVYAQGEIFYGEGNAKIIGQGIMLNALKKAREDDNIKAIVLRVNSPGGSALTSDIIWREVALTKAVKPVVVSMGDVAASGGYYIATGADKIFAEPTTITGSIGVFGTIPNVAELSKKIGVNAEQVGTHKNSIDYSLFEPITDGFKNVVQESIAQTYRTFLSRVAEGRGITMEEADEIAQGRVWSGTEAKRIGLVDELGGLEDALGAAAEMANLDAYSIKNFPKYKSGFEQLMENLEGSRATIMQRFIEDEIGIETYHLLKEVKFALEQKGIQARLPFVLSIK